MRCALRRGHSQQARDRLDSVIVFEAPHPEECTQAEERDGSEGESVGASPRNHDEDSVYRTLPVFWQFLKIMNCPRFPLPRARKSARKEADYHRVLSVSPDDNQS